MFQLEGFDELCGLSHKKATSELVSLSPCKVGCAEPRCFSVNYKRQRLHYKFKRGYFYQNNPVYMSVSTGRGDMSRSEQDTNIGLRGPSQADVFYML